MSSKTQSQAFFLYIIDCFSWGYVILYLIIIIIGLIGNFTFCVIIKKNEHLHRTHHFFFLSIAVMDMLACVLVIPFNIDASVSRSTVCPKKKLTVVSLKLTNNCQVFLGDKLYLKQFFYTLRRGASSMVFNNDDNLFCSISVKVCTLAPG